MEEGIKNSTKVGVQLIWHGTPWDHNGQWIMTFFPKNLGLDSLCLCLLTKMSWSELLAWAVSSLCMLDLPPTTARGEAAQRETSQAHWGSFHGIRQLMPVRICWGKTKGSKIDISFTRYPTSQLVVCNQLWNRSGWCKICSLILRLREKECK